MNSFEGCNVTAVAMAPPLPLQSQGWPVEGHICCSCAGGSKRRSPSTMAR